MVHDNSVRLLQFVALLLLLGFAGFNCGDPAIVDKNYKCDKDADCKNSHVCQGGNCVLADFDKDGWAKNKDCNDNNKEIFPGAPEICDNGADDNCDGQTDEKPCQCIDGSVRACGEDKGICKQGQQTCRAGIWGKCEGMIEPQEEICDGKDNDCDGNVDEGVPNCCQPKETRPCGPGEGECKQGIQTCQVGQWSECKGAIGPKPEECNGKDDDCDGKVDNIKDSTDPIQQDCYSGPPETRKKGECKDGTQECKNGQWGLCQQDTLPQDEICDDKDNDCDGQIDNQKNSQKLLERECYSADPKTKGVGVCKGGTQRCITGRWSGCLGEITPITEVCNGIDDDCDGQMDNTPGSTDPLSRACYSGPADTRQKGLCQDGKQECSNGRWSSCKNDRLPDAELCDNRDNDCDGRTDNIPGKPDSLVGPCYTGPQGTKNVGTCKEGKRTCVNGTWTSCTQEQWPQKEVCDGKDNDCDGQTDEGISASGNCTTGKPGICSTGKKQCNNGKLTCVQVNQPQAEICDGKDNNCNGAVDENNPGGGGSCNAPNTKGLCLPGVKTCTNGKVICRQVIFPTNEICDGKDNNCNGTVDDNATCPKGSQCSSSTCKTCTQPGDTKCSNFDLFCTKDAPAINCRCGFKSYCKQKSSSIFCSGCCAIRSCQ